MEKTPVSILSAPATPTQAQFKVNFNQNPFNDSILTKGYNVLHSKALSCPCGTELGGSPACQNCGGTGYFYIETRRTKALVQGITSSDKQGEIGMSNATSARITMRGEDAPTYEDKIVVLDLETNFAQLVQTRRFGRRIYGFSIYNMLEVYAAYAFVSDAEKLQLLVPYTVDTAPWDYKFRDNLLELNPVNFPDGGQTYAVSLRYRHHPTYFIKSLDREVFHTEVNAVCDPTAPRMAAMPVKCTGIRAHYVPQNANLNGPRLFDNTDYSKFPASEYSV